MLTLYIWTVFAEESSCSIGRSRGIHFRSSGQGQGMWMFIKQLHFFFFVELNKYFPLREHPSVCSTHFDGRYDGSIYSIFYSKFNIIYDDRHLDLRCSEGHPC